MEISSGIVVVADYLPVVVDPNRFGQSSARKIKQSAATAFITIKAAGFGDNSFEWRVRDRDSLNDHRRRSSDLAVFVYPLRHGRYNVLGATNLALPHFLVENKSIWT